MGGEWRRKGTRLLALGGVFSSLGWTGDGWGGGRGVEKVENKKGDGSVPSTRPGGCNWQIADGGVLVLDPGF